MANSSAGNDVERGRQRVEVWSSASKIRWRIVRCGHLISAPLRSPSNAIPLCPVCDQPVPLSGPGRAVSYVRDYVPGESLSWQTAHEKRKLASQTSAQFEFEMMLALMSTGQQQVDLTSQCPQAHPTSAPAASFLVWRATPAGCTVQQGTVTLPKDGILLLAGHGAHFTGTTFSGGALMCAGADFNGRFRHCAFRQCTLYAVHGACVHLHACTFDRGVPAVVASGAATAAHFTSCVFHACQTALVTDRGANVAMRGCSVIGSTSAVVVIDPGSHAEVDETHIMPAHSGPAVMDAYGVITGSGGGVRMHACEMRSIAYPVVGCASSVEVHSTRITDYAYGVAAAMHATVAMRDVEMQNRPGLGPIAEARKGGVVTWGNTRDRRSAHVQMHQCSMHATTGNAVILSRARADVLLCVLSCLGGAVVVAADRAPTSAHVRFCSAHTTSDTAACQVVSHPAASRTAALRMHGCTLRADKSRCALVRESAFVATDTQFEAGAPDMRGMIDLLDSTASMVRCTIRSFTEGVVLKGSTVRLVDTGIVSLKLGIEHGQVPGTAWTHGAMHDSGCATRVCTGRFEMKGGRIQGFEHGVVATVDAGTGTAFMQLEGVSFHGCYYSVVGDGRLTAEVRRCRFAGCDVARAREVMSEIARGSTDKDYPLGVSFVDVDGGLVEGCEFDGPWVGVEVDCARAVEVRDSVFCCSGAEPWLWPCITVQQAVVVEDCELAGPRAGVVVDEGGQATIRRCSFRPDGAAAVMCRRGSRARMLGCSVHSAEQGVMMMQHSELEVQDCEFEGVRNGILAADGGVTIAAERLSVQATTGGVLLQCVAGGPSELRLVECSFRGGRAGVTITHAAVSASLLRCTIADAETGLSASGSCSVRMRDSTVSGCTVGAVIGASYSKLLHKCQVCGRCGKSAFKHAMKELLRGRPPHAGGGGEWGPQCSHEGAVTRAVMERVRVLRCDHMGVEVNMGGHLTAQEVHAVRCGFQVMEAAEESRFEGCTVTEGHQAMAMSAWEDAPAGMHGAPVSVPPMRLLTEVTVAADPGQD